MKKYNRLSIVIALSIHLCTFSMHQQLLTSEPQQHNHHIFQEAISMNSAPKEQHIKRSTTIATLSSSRKSRQTTKGKESVVTSSEMRKQAHLKLKQDTLRLEEAKMAQEILKYRRVIPYDGTRKQCECIIENWVEQKYRELKKQPL